MPDNKKKRKPGRPLKYNPYYPEIAEVFCREDGYTDKQLAGLFGVSEACINLWKLQYLDFFTSVKKGKWSFDSSKVVGSLLKSARGYSYDEVTKERVAAVYSEKGDLLTPERMAVTKIVGKEVPAQQVAQIFWLKNRQPNDWSDKKEIDVKGSVDTVVLSQAEHDEKLKKIREAGTGIDEKSIFGGGDQ